MREVRPLLPLNYWIYTLLMAPSFIISIIPLNYSINPASNNTQSKGETTILNGWGFLEVKEFALNRPTKLGVFSVISMGNAYLYNWNGSKLIEMNTVNTLISTLLVKDPFLLYISSKYSDEKITKKKNDLYRIQGIEGKGYSMATHIIVSHESTILFTFTEEEPGTSNIIAAYRGKLMKIDTADQCKVSGGVIYGWPFKIERLYWMNINDVFVIAQIANVMPMVDKATLKVIKDFTFPFTLSDHLLDNLNNSILYGYKEYNDMYSIEYMISKLELSINGISYTETATLPRTIEGLFSRLLNFGPYQYVITLPAYNSIVQLIFIDKTTWKFYTRSDLILDNNKTGTWAQFRSFMGWDFFKGRYHFAYVNFNTSNYQSYYIEVNNCYARGTDGICDSCQAGSFLTDANPNNLCYFPEEFDKGFGADTTVTPIKTCQVEGCISCLNDYKKCAQCDSTRGYSLVYRTGLCNLTKNFIYFPVELLEEKKDSLAASFILSPTYDSPLENVEQKVKSFSQLVNFTVDILNTKTQIKEVSLSPRMSYFEKKIVLDVDLSSVVLEGNDYKIVLNRQEVDSAFINDEEVSFVSFEGSVDFFNQITAKETKTAQTTGEVVGIIAGKIGDSTPPIQSLGLGFIFAFDITGEIFRSAKVLQIMNKVYFININHGKKLDAFLSQTTSIVQFDRNTRYPQRVFNEPSFRGKLSKNKITLDFPLKMTFQIIMYISSWIMQAVKSKMMKNTQMGKLGIYYCYYSNKMHLVVFNVVFVDFIWLAYRTVFHTKSIGLLRLILSQVIIVLVMVDICKIISHLHDDRVWNHLYTHNMNKMKVKPSHKKTNGQIKPKDPESLPPNQAGIRPSRNLERSDLNQSTSNLRNNATEGIMNKTPPQVSSENQRSIDYRNTYREITFNSHLMEMASSPLRIDREVYGSSLCRWLACSSWIRVPLIMLLISSCQYSNKLVLLSFISIEFGRLASVMYAYVRFKHLNSIVRMMMEVSQGAFLCVFICGSLLTSGKRQDETVSMLKQDMCIWVIVLACCIEYMLLAVNLCIAVYRYSINRKILRTNNLVRIEYSIIKYHDDDVKINNESQIKRDRMGSDLLDGSNINEHHLTIRRPSLKVIGPTPRGSNENQGVRTVTNSMMNPKRRVLRTAMKRKKQMISDDPFS